MHLSNDEKMILNPQHKIYFITHLGFITHVGVQANLSEKGLFSLTKYLDNVLIWNYIND